MQRVLTDSVLSTPSRSPFALTVLIETFSLREVEVCSKQLRLSHVAS
jgi:hypothetical protein